MTTQNVASSLRVGEYLKNRDNEMGVLRARKIEQTAASESRSDYLLEITFLFPLSLVAVEGNGEKRERRAEGEERGRGRENVT